jgi:hypothetical protein
MSGVTGVDKTTCESWALAGLLLSCAGDGRGAARWAGSLRDIWQSSSEVGAQEVLREMGGVRSNHGVTPQRWGESQSSFNSRSILAQTPCNIIHQQPAKPPWNQQDRQPALNC